MRKQTMTGICVLLVATAIGNTDVWAARKKVVVETPLTETGQQLEQRYSAMLATQKAEITKAVPTLTDQKKSDYLKAREIEKAAVADRNAKLETLNKSKGSAGLLNHRKGWIGRATTGVAEAKANLKKAKAIKGDKAAKDKALKDANQALAKIQANYDMAASELKKAQAAVAKSKKDEPKLTKDLETAQKALDLAQANTQKAIKGLGLNFLASDKLDAKLATYVVLRDATPRGLAEFSQQGKNQEKLVDQLLADTGLMTQMLVADGAQDGKYGQAMQIYTDIQKASKKAGNGVLQRLAVATSLEHATPIKLRDATGKTDAPEHVDPIQRYLNFEKAFLAGELDPAFKNLDVFSYRFVINGEEPDEILDWGRKMLRNYRPDHITTSDYRWRYVSAVRTEVRYGSHDNKFDKPELQFFQNIMLNGGVCGRRAFFGRFILRAFGIPVTARPQRGHAALAHWTPKGWVVCLGGGWGIGWTMTPYKKDLEFLATTQARENAKSFKQVKRAQWIGDVNDEKQTFGFLSGDPDLWYGVSLYLQRGIIADAKAVALAAVGTDLGEANESKVKEKVKTVTISEEDRKVVVGKGGVITIPAAACSKPTNSTAKIKFMPSNLGGMQLHYERTSTNEEFEYTFQAPSAGKYTLTARVVTPSWKQHLILAVNGTANAANIELPHTIGMWDKTQPVEVKLSKGKNVLTFSHKADGYAKGFTIKDFTLTPVK
jgi:hypothetical protein